jgi:hypothetical protein
MHHILLRIMTAIFILHKYIMQFSVPKSILYRDVELVANMTTKSIKMNKISKASLIAKACK